MSQVESNTVETKKKSGIHPWIWGGLLFWGVVFAMNAHFLSKAFQVSPELVTENYYEKGLVHDQTVEEKQAWLESGLSVKIEKSLDAWKVVLNKPVEQVSGQLYRASNKHADIESNPVMNTNEISFSRPTLNGVWELNLRVQDQGKWMTYHQRLSN